MKRKMKKNAAENKEKLMKEFYPEEYGDALEESETEQDVLAGEGRSGVMARRVIALVLLFVFAFVLTLGTVGSAAVLSTGATLEEAIKEEDFYSLKNSQYYVIGKAYNLILEDISKDAFWVDGVYDENQTVDITNLDGGVLVYAKNAETTYKLKDLVTMYEAGVDGKLLDIVERSEDEANTDYPEIIAYLEQNYETDAYYVDNLGNLYASITDDAMTDETDAWTIDEYISELPIAPAQGWDPLGDKGFALYTVKDKQAELCFALPEGFEYMEPLSWSEFSARHMIDISGLTDREQMDFDYAAYGDMFQYLYKYGMEIETLLPESGEKLAVYALRYPAQVSIYDLYKQLAAAIETVGSAVANEEYKNVDAQSEQDENPQVYYWVKDAVSKNIWTNHPQWNVTDISAVEKAIADYNSKKPDGLYYPFYMGRASSYEIYGTGDYYDTEMVFASTDNVVEYSDSVQTMLLEQFGIEQASCVIAYNPKVLDAEYCLDYYVGGEATRVQYETYVPYMEYYLLMVLVGGVGTIVCGIISIVMAGRRDKTKIRYAGPFARYVPIELLILLDVGCWIGYGVMAYACIAEGQFGWNNGLSLSDYIWIAAFLIGFIILVTWQVLTLVIKGKSKNMRTNSLIGRAGNEVSKAAKTSAFTRKCPIEIMLAIFLVIWIVFGCVMKFWWNLVGGGLADLILLAVTFVGIAMLIWWQITTLVHKGKTKNMLTNSLGKRFGGAVTGGIKKFYRNRKVTGKLFLLSIIICVGHLVIIGVGYATDAVAMAIILLIIIWILLIVLLMKKCLQKQRIKDGIREIAGGNMEYQIKMEKLSGDELDMAWDLNNIQEGMENAVERMMKSERMKTDLITNVSHDLKTPLTSIINYVDILKKEDIQDPKIRGYIDILEQKSLRLKNLTEDLMEAAKISSGNITLELQNINLKQLLYQTNGEFEEKFAKRNLQLVCTLPDSDVFICADGRRMWRVIENLYNNAAKYAQPYSRVYVDGKLQSGKVQLIIKNVSEAPLNISADELMERFVRGDVARNTEGSGLGLEIARNLTVMQKGTFDIQLDGDLFKVILTFDAV